MPSLESTLIVVRDDGRSRKVHCPAHEDQQASLHVSRGRNGGLVLHCHAGCSTESVVSAAGLGMADLAPSEIVPRGTSPARRTVPGDIVATYDYRDERGVVLYQSCRLEPKGFFQRRPAGAGRWINSIGDVRRVPYRLDRLAGRAAVWIVEGEKDADRLWTLGCPATTNAGGAGKWSDGLTGDLVRAGVKHVAILPDNDAAGQEHAEKMAQSCQAAGLDVRLVALPGLPAKGDVSDWLDAGHTVEELRERSRKAPKVNGIPPRMSAVITRLSDVDMRPIDWHWRYRVARGKPTILAGDPGVSKSTLWLDMVARTTTGRGFPDGEPAPQGACVILSAEDALDDTVKPRLAAAGADMTRIVSIDAIRHVDRDEQRLVNLERDITLIEEVIQDNQAALVVIDPLNAYLPPKLDAKSDHQVRAILAPLSKMAERQHVALILVMHLTKNTSQKVLHRVIGSIGFAALARVVLGVTEDPDNDARRLLMPLKQNHKPAPVLAYRLRSVDVETDHGLCETLRLEWEDAPVTGINADQVFAMQADEDRVAADEFLQGIIAPGDRVKSNDVFRQAKAQGISIPSVRRAQKRLGIRAVLEGFGSKGTWYWWWPLSEAMARRDDDESARDDQKNPVIISESNTPSKPLLDNNLIRDDQDTTGTIISGQDDQRDISHNVSSKSYRDDHMGGDHLCEKARQSEEMIRDDHIKYVRARDRDDSITKNGHGNEGEMVILEYPAKGGNAWPLTFEQLQQWETMYADVDVEQELNKALAWCEANPAKLKTNVQRFLVNWLNHAGAER